MDRKAAPAALAFLLAILGVAYLPRKAGESSATSETTKQNRSASSKTAAQKSASAGSPAAASECQAIVHQIRRFYPGSFALPDSCFPETPNRSKLILPEIPDLHFVIAIVPNPVQTHLPLLFDRSIEVIQQAAQDEGYSYDGSWFPWDNTVSDSDSLDDTEIAKTLEEDKHKQPGVLVFRRGLTNPDELRQPYSGGLVVFLVGEQPTGGIDDVQFGHALEWLYRLNRLQPNSVDPVPCAPRPAADDSNQGPCETLRILGPTFSGSLQSLARELDQNVIPKYSNGIRVYSGSANSYSSVVWFKNFLKAKDPLLKFSNEKPLYHFRTYFENDSLMTDRFLCYLRFHDYSLNRVAILSEDQTAYGSQRPKTSPKSTNDQAESAAPTIEAGPKQDDPALKCGGTTVDHQQPINLYYPRDIASLRSAYEKQSIFSAGKPQSSSDAPSTTLRGDLSEPASSEHDSVRDYAGQLTPLAQESVLFGIANVLESKHIDFVILRSTNPLDQLFLSEFLRRSYPTGRVVIDASDLLFRRGMQGASLRGVMLLSTYPLLSWTQDLIPTFRAANNGSYRVFAQDTSEGLYIAARELFPSAATDVKVPIGDYAPLQATKPENLKSPDEENQPATWVSVVGHRQFWPLAVLNSNTEVNSKGEPYGPLAERHTHDESLLTHEDGGNRFDANRPRDGRLPGELVGLALLSLALGFCHLYFCWKGSIIGTPRVRAYFAPIPRMQHLVLISLGSLFIGYLGVTIALTLGIGSEVFAKSSSVKLALVATLLVLCGLVGCLANFTLPLLSPYVSRVGSLRIERWRLRSLLIWPAVLLVLGLMRKMWLSDHLTAANQYATILRSAYLRSGVSPLLPQVLLLLGMYAWFWFNLQGLALFGADRPVLPRRRQLPKVDVPTRQHHGHTVNAHETAAFRMFSQDDAGMDIEDTALPLTSYYGISLLVFLFLTILVSQLAIGEFSLRTLGDRRFGELIFFWICLFIAMILADTLQFSRTWSRLRRLLIFMDRLRLRRTLEALKGLSWDSVWKMSGNVMEQRYRLISRQFESMSNLRNILEAWQPADVNEIQARSDALQQLKRCGHSGTLFADWYVNLGHSSRATDLTDLRNFQRELAAAAGCVMTTIILPAWHKETQSLILDSTISTDTSKWDEPADQPAKDEGDKDGNSTETGHKTPADVAASERKTVVQAAEEFFVLPYLGFIQNTIGRIRSIALSILTLFVAATLAISSYPFDPLPTIGALFLVIFLLAGVVVVYVYAEMHRDSTLSLITNKKPGELGFDFWMKLIAFGVGPLIGLLTTLFPSMTDFVVSFLQPGAQAIK